ncbi:MAG: hypothetical protein QW117_01085 [Candidatus Pacearchaeota archaeon]
MEKIKVEDILKKYGAKIEKEIRSDIIPYKDFSRDYKKFKEEMYYELNWFEKLCKGIGNSVKIKPSKKDYEKIKKEIEKARLDITPEQVASLSVVSLFLTFFFGTLLSILIFLLTDVFPFILLFFFLLFSIFLFYYFYTTPNRLANQRRLKTSSQMVPCILYIIAYMKHTSNLERAISFAAKHLQPPLSLDLKKVFWDVEIGKYSNLKESLEAYLETWKDDNIEFVEAFHLIESSLYEIEETRRITILEKALQVVLDGIYDKMLKYSRDIRSPLTNIYMLGIILPTLAIALLPLASTMLAGIIKWYHVFFIFNVIVPFFVFFMSNEILYKRPGGYGETELLELNKDYKKFIDKKPFLISFFLILPLLMIGFLPFIFQTNFINNLGLKNDYTFREIGFRLVGFEDLKIFDFKNVGKTKTGPFGIIALILSLFIPLSIGIFFSFAYNRKTKDLIIAKEKSKKLEDEFASSLFQLGNRLGDGMPAEIAFSHVAKSVKGQTTEGFFNIVNQNMHQLGMNLEEAIFNKRRGAIIYYPSALIATSMMILIESVKKGLKIAASSLMSISEYTKNVKKIEERLKDLLAEITSDMRSNMTFLAPLLAGIIIGLTGMITNILTKLNISISGIGAEEVSEAIGGFGNILSIFNLQAMIPPYFLQIVIGIYIIEITFILSYSLVTIENGYDKLRIVNETGKNLKRGIIMYFIIAFMAILILSLLSSFALSAMNLG